MRRLLLTLGPVALLVVLAPSVLLWRHRRRAPGQPPPEWLEGWLHGARWGGRVLTVALVILALWSVGR